MSSTYRAAVVERFGPPENIRIHDLPLPTPRAGEVRVAVRTGGMNPIDARIRGGSFGGRAPMGLGTEFAGIIDEVGQEVTGFAPGDAVIGFGARNADADLVIVGTTQLVAKPEGIGWDLAGGISGVGQSALTALDALEIETPSTFVVHGASGGVGSVLIQLAVSAGYRVIGTASASRQDYLRELGATAVTYGPGLAERLAEAAPDGIDASIDLAGTSEAGEIGQSVQASGGAAITLVPETTSSHGTRLVRTQTTRARLETLLAALQDGRLSLEVEAIPFTEIVEAHRRLDAHHARGKTVLDLSDNPHLPRTAGDSTSTKDA